MAQFDVNQTLYVMAVSPTERSPTVRETSPAQMGMDSGVVAFTTAEEAWAQHEHELLVRIAKATERLDLIRRNRLAATFGVELNPELPGVVQLPDDIPF